jgi:hypothetical protein
VIRSLRFLLFLFVAALLVLGCAASSEKPEKPKPTPPLNCDRTFVLGLEFPEHERGAINRATTRWNAFAVEKFCVVEGDSSPEDVKHGIFRIVYGGEYWRQLSQSFGGSNVVGVHFGETDRIGIVDSLTEFDFELVALHEFGHAHGLGHTPAPSIMHASLRTAFDFTTFDFEECRRVGACVGNSGGVFISRQPDTHVCAR